MKFGKLDNPEDFEYILPPDHLGTKLILEKGNKEKIPLSVYVGCAKWNRTDLKNFYPRGVKDELEYYATQFNSIELNATFYSNFSVETMHQWKQKTPDSFRFFPKIHQSVSHWKRLKDAQEPTDRFLDVIAHLEGKLGMLFLQLPDNFGPKRWEDLRDYLSAWPDGFPLALELRHKGWYDGSWESELLYELLESKNLTHVITDTAGRRDLLHMRLTSDTAFIRYNGANVPSDYTRLDDWVERLGDWTDAGLKKIYFFIHQNMEKESPLLAAYFIDLLNKKYGLNLQVPKGLAD